jgi:FHS family Na+ dependent glucose MFS transporter 1
VSPAASDEALVAGRSVNQARTASYFAAFIILGLAAAILGPALPNLAERTQTMLSQISVLFIGRNIGYLVGSLLGGRLYDRLPGHWLLGGSLLLISATLALAPAIPLLWLLALVLVFLGSAEGALDVGGNTLLVWVYQQRVGPYMNGLHFFFGAGAFLTPIVVAQAYLVRGDVTWAFWILALLALPVALWVLRLPSPLAAEPEAEGSDRQVDYRLVALIAVFFFLYVGAEVSFGGWAFTYATRQLGAGLSVERSAAYLTSAFWGALTVGRLIGIPVAARVRPRLILLVDLLGCMASVVLILAFPGSWVALWVGTIGTGLFMASIFPTTFNMAERRMALSGSVNAWFFVGAALGGMALPWLIGQFFEGLGPTVVMYAILADLLLALAGFVFMVSYFKPVQT